MAQASNWQPPGAHQRAIVHSKTTNRRQHRSCDQCRKGKRACDATISEQLARVDHDPAFSSPLPTSPTRSASLWPLDGSPHTDNRTEQDQLDHSSVVAKARCSNCAKTGKRCTFEWLRSTQDLAVRRRKRNGVEPQSIGQPEEPPLPKNRAQALATPFLNHSSPFYNGMGRDVPLPLSAFPEDLYVTPLDKMGQLASFPSSEESVLDFNQINSSGCWSGEPEISPLTLDFRPENSITDPDFSYYGSMDGTDLGSSLPTQSQFMSNNSTSSIRFDPRHPKRARKSDASRRTQSFGSTASADRRRSSLYRPGWRPSLWPEHSSLSERSTTSSGPSSNLLQQLVSSNNRSFLTSNLIRVYHDSMENALSCWLTERTCPYSAESLSLVPSVSSHSQESMLEEWGPNWSNRICTRVCHLDRVSSAIRDRPLTKSEDKAASRALHAAIMSFATQWAQSSARSASEFSSFTAADNESNYRSDEFLNDEMENGGASASGARDPASPLLGDFDRTMQESCWYQARQTLQETAGIESFRVIFAHIIFALTQRPLNIDKHVQAMKTKHRRFSTSSEGATRPNPGDAFSQSSYTNFRRSSPVGSTYSGAESGLAELDEIIDFEGPPLFLETALRQIFSYRCKLERIERQRATQIRILETNNMANYKASRADPLSVEDRKTFNLLFWLGIMFDTLSAAMNKRPLVVSDEDSNILQGSPWDTSKSGENGMGQDSFDSAPTSYASMFAEENDSNLWGKFLLEQKRLRYRQYVPRWPCSYDDAAATLCDAAPIKVLLFRKVTHLQTLLSRRAKHEKIEEAIHDALKVHKHWNDTYGLFIIDCIASHDDLPPRIQSWYVVLAGHWHLAGLLLADMIEAIDEAKMGLEMQRNHRQSSLLVAGLRKQNTFAISNLSRCASPRPDSSFPDGPEFHTALNKGALLTEPWTVVLIRSFGKAGYILLESLPPSNAESTQGKIPIESEADVEEARLRCELCIQALWYLGKKSDMAYLAATALSHSFKDKTSSYTPTLSTGFSAYVDLDPSTGPTQEQHGQPDFAPDEPFTFMFSAVPSNGFLDTPDICQVWG